MAESDNTDGPASTSGKTSDNTPPPPPDTTMHKPNTIHVKGSEAGQEKRED